MAALIRIGNGALRLYKATDGMRIKGAIDSALPPVLLDWSG